VGCRRSKKLDGWRWHPGETFGAPLCSSHLALSLNSELGGRGKGRRPSVLVVIADPSADGGAGFLEGMEGAPTDALLFEASEEACDPPELFEGVRGDEFLGEPTVPTGGTEAAALEAQAVASADKKGISHRSRYSEAPQTAGFQGAVGLPRTVPQRELAAGDLAVMAAEDGGQVVPAVGVAGYVGDVHGPPLVTRRRLTRAALGTGPRRPLPLMHE